MDISDQKFTPNTDLMKTLNSIDVTKLVPKILPERQVLPDLTFSTDYNSTAHDELFESIRINKEEEEQRELAYREAVLNLLQGIEKNTALLTEMTFLLQKSSEDQEETFKLMVEILAIMKSETQEEAASKFTNVMQKITDFTENASTVQSLCGMANTVYNAFKSLL